MSLSVGQARLHEAYKELCIHWANTKQEWNDVVARRFQEEHLDPIESHIKATMRAMEEMSEATWRAQRDCE